MEMSGDDAEKLPALSVDCPPVHAGLPPSNTGWASFSVQFNDLFGKSESAQRGKGIFLARRSAPAGGGLSFFVEPWYNILFQRKPNLETEESLWQIQ